VLGDQAPAGSGHDFWISISHRDIDFAPKDIQQRQNLPNRSVAEHGRVTLGVYDASGRLVRLLVDKRQGAGSYTEMWNGLNENGSVVASGVYFVRLESAGQVITRKAVLSK
jgi:flagellar hook assembly protein FlgD